MAVAALHLTMMALTTLPLGPVVLQLVIAFGVRLVVIRKFSSTLHAALGDEEVIQTNMWND